MRLLNRITGAAAAMFGRKRQDADLDEELQAFHAASVEAKLATGMDRAAAERAARLEVGSRAAVKDWVGDVGWESRLESAWYDLRFAARILRRSPGFTAVAIVTLALGTGANAAMFQLLNAVRFRPLPVEAAHELVAIRIDRHGKGRVGVGYGGGVHTEPLWRAIESRQQAFSSLFAWGTDVWNLSVQGELAPAQGLYVSGGFFEGLGLAPQAGRLFSPADDQKGCGAPAVVLSHAFWQSRYGGDAGTVGQTLTLNRRPFEIIGVAPQGFFGIEVGGSFDVAIPLCAEPLMRGERAGTGQPHVWWLDIMGRLAPGWSLQQAEAHLASLSPGAFESTVPPTYNAEMAANYRASTLTPEPAATGTSALRTQYSTHLWLLLGGTALVLLITCANLANLMLARATARDREIAVRLAIGASRARVARQLLVESILIAAGGVVAGLVAAQWLSQGLLALLSPDGEIVLDTTADWRVFAFTAAVAAGACVLFGVSPALRAMATDPQGALQTGGRAGTDARAALGFRRVLVVAQVALSVVLIVAALLFARSLRNLGAVDLGFDPDVLVATADIRPTGAPPEARDQILRDVLAGIRRVPGVRYASEAFIVPLSGPDWNMRITIGGAVQDGDVRFNSIGTDYFRTLGIPILAGRAFEDGDRRDAPTVAVVNQSFATRYFPGRSPVGEAFGLDAPAGAAPPRFHIVGVVPDTKYRELREADLPIVYLAMAQEAQVPPIVEIIIRSDLPFTTVRSPLTEAIAAAAPGATVSYATIQSSIQALLHTDRLMAALSGFFGGLAVLIAVIGLYAVMSYVVSRRKVEIGIRMALGARPGTVVRMMLAESGRLLALGAAAGVLLGMALSRYAGGLLYGVTALDPLSFALAIGSLGVVGLMASWIPAHRASRVPPTIAIRH